MTPVLCCSLFLDLTTKFCLDLAILKLSYQHEVSTNMFLLTDRAF